MSTCSLAPFIMMSLYLEQMSQTTGSTIGMLAISMSISTVGSAIGAATIGRVLKVINRKVMIITAGIMIFTFQATISRSINISSIYVAAFVNGVGSTWGGIAMAQIVIAQWFEKMRGTMMSLCMVVMGIVLTVTIPVIGNLIAIAGYQPIVMIIGIAAGAGVILSAFLVSGAPEKYGLKPYGAAEAVGGGAQYKIPPSLPFNKVIRNNVFWTIVLIVFLCTLVAQGFSSQAAVIFRSLGLNPVNAAYVLAIFTLFGMPWQFIFGFLCDKIGPKYAMTIAGSVCCVVLLLTFLWTGFAGALIIAFGMAACGCLAGLYGPNMAPRLFGVKDVGDIIGFIIMAGSAGATIGPLIFGFMYDSFGSYTTALIMMGLILAVCLVLNFWLSSKKNLEMIKQQIAAET